MYTITKIVSKRANGGCISNKVLQLCYNTYDAAIQAIKRLVKGMKCEITPSGHSAFVFTKSKIIHLYVSQYGTIN